jgi:hypothetical protein
VVKAVLSETLMVSLVVATKLLRAVKRVWPVYLE